MLDFIEWYWWRARVLVVKCRPAYIREVLRRPRVGDWVEDCRFEWHQVTKKFGDDLVLDDGANCSWTHCCGVKSRTKPV